jgi:hypothetical protein
VKYATISSLKREKRASTFEERSKDFFQRRV